jgi:CubicO group peptidase (beta-lactamase class C family)
VEALRQVEDWPVGFAAAGVVTAEGPVATHGDPRATLPWASVTKLLTALASLVAAEEGVLELDEPAGPSGSTVRHLLAHASGLPPDGETPIAQAGTRRIYSNAGFEVLARFVTERAELAFTAYLRHAVREPLSLSAVLDGSPASGVRGTLTDLIALGREFLAPTVIASETLSEATAVAFRGLVGVLPGFGRMDPNDWGLGFEVRDEKRPHWTGERNSPQTFGHFGQSGSFLWVDPVAGVACACLCDRDFGDWAKDAWPRLSDAILAELA